MSIGIMDADLSKYRLVAFNLEAMKLSAYYKKRGEIVIFSPTFNPERNTKFFFRKDYEDGDYPLGVTTSENVEYGGLAFSRNIYQPMSLEIEKTPPDASLYEKAESLILESGVGSKALKHKVFQNMMSSEHLRLSLDGKTVWKDYPCQFKHLSTARNIMLHDYDLGAVNGSFRAVQRILKNCRHGGQNTRVGMKFPVRLTDAQDLLNWSSLNPNSTFFSIRFDGMMDNDTFNAWVTSCYKRASYAQLEYWVTSPAYGPADFVENQLPRLLRQIIISRSYRVFFRLKYDEDFFPDKRWCDVLRLFKFYNNSYIKKPISEYYAMINHDTLYDFARSTDEIPIKYDGEVYTREKIREIFAFVREHHYSLFKDFYECNAEKLGGWLT